MKTGKLFCVFLLLTFFQVSCNNEKVTSSKCGTSFKEADSLLKHFYINQDSLQLSNLLQRIDSCENDSLRRMKIHILLLLDKCREGFDFVEGINPEAFKYPYRKIFFGSLFKACNNPSVDEKIYLNQAVEEISTFLQQNPKVEEAWFDLFNLKKRMLSQSELSKELDSLSLIIDKEIVELLRFNYLN